MLTAWMEITGLIERNAKHRKGFRLQEITPADVLKHALEEINELRDAPEDIDELGDAVACLLHYAIRRGWTLQDLESAIVRKLIKRFPEDQIVGRDLPTRIDDWLNDLMATR